MLFSEKLVSIAPKGLEKVFYSDNGSTAVETALKMSVQYWQNIGIKGKTKFLSLDYGYHGDTVGALSVSSLDLFQKVFKPLLFPCYKIKSPYCYRCPVGKDRLSCSLQCIKYMEDVLEKYAKQISAIILEPIVLAAGGMIVYPEEYLKKVFELSKKHNVHLILDEVATGMGRTGKMFACEYARISPDFLCLSKGITSGYLPLGVTLTTKKIYDAFYDRYENKKTFFHGHTYAANPISVSAALASLDIFESERIIQNIQGTISFFHRELERFKGLPIVGDVRYKGLIGAFELVKDKNTKQMFDFDQRIGFRIYKQGLKNHLILRPLGHIIYLFLPLCIKQKDMTFILNRTYHILEHTKQ
jgi:adenosylmethionine-8-amino-7-oxononanoate aminotransferase